jgi:hypothetical protein
VADRPAVFAVGCKAVVDSQSVKAPAAQRRGFDAGKKVVGRKRHIAVDTDGRLLMVNLTTADISVTPEADGADRQVETGQQYRRSAQCGSANGAAWRGK